MKPAWDKLAKEYADSKVGLVADVDCTTEGGKQLCGVHGVQGFPTIKWGDPSALEDYSGGRSFDDLKKFADENLKPMCSPAYLELCSEDKKTEIATLQALPAAELSAKIAAKEQEMKVANDEFDSEVQKLQTTYEQLQKQGLAEEKMKTEVGKLQSKYEELDKAKTATVDAIKASGLGLMKAVAAHSAPKDEL